MCDYVTGVIKKLVTQSINITHTDTIQKLSLQYNITFPQTCNATKFCFYFHNCENRYLVPTGAWYQEWNKLCMERWWFEVGLRLATNIICTTVLVLLLILNYCFCNSGYVILYPQPRSTIDGYSSFMEHHHHLCYAHECCVYDLTFVHPCLILLFLHCMLLFC